MKGVEVKLLKKTLTGTDMFNQPIYETQEVAISDVLVGEPSSADIENNITVYGKKTAYTLAIPKGDDNTWEDSEVILPAPWSATFKVIGSPTAGIEANIPLRWNKKVHLERLEG